MEAENIDSNYPIDESEDFQDPFSDLSLYLAKRVRTAIDKHGSSSGWSSRIQSDLLKNILPEFRQAFPGRRLGPSALKKVWDKVAFYYNKLGTQKEALKENGTVNLDYMIRENLRTEKKEISASLPPYHAAHEMAMRMSECLATVEGEKPRIEEMTRLIWSMHKHLMPNLPAAKAKNAYSEYTALDKLIVKMQLETTANEPFLSEQTLKKRVEKRLLTLKEYLNENSKEQIYASVAHTLAVKLFPSISIAKDERFALFIKHQLELFSDPVDTASKIEIAQRILALYPLATHLPSELDLDMISNAISALHAMMNDYAGPECPAIDEILFTFLSHELNFLERKGQASDLEFVKRVIIDTLLNLKNLPLWQDKLLGELEIAIWAYCSEGTSNEWLENELASVVIDNPDNSFSTIVYKTMDMFKKAKVALNECHNTEHRIRSWTVQSDMLLRYIHFDENTALYRLMIDLWNEKGLSEESVDHKAFIELCKKKFLRHFKSLKGFEAAASQRLWIVYKYIWYHSFSLPEESTFERFLRFHMQTLKNQLGGGEDEIYKALSSITTLLLPLAPFERKSLRYLRAS